MTDEISREEYAELALTNEVLRLKKDDLSALIKAKDNELYEKCERIDKLKSSRTQLLTSLKKEQKFLTDSVQANDKLKETIIHNEEQIARLNEVINYKNAQIDKLKTNLHHADEDSKIAITEAVERTENTTSRANLPDTRKSITHKFFINGHEGYMTVGLFEDGTPGELFIRMAKEGSTIGGLMDAIGILTSMCLQHGMTVEKLREKFEHGRFEPSGFTHCKEIGDASSITDYIFRWMDLKFIEGRV